MRGPLPPHPRFAWVWGEGSRNEDASRTMNRGTVIGVDVGGTFTDFVVAGPGGLRITKVPSTPPDASDAILAGLAALGVGEWTRFVHGSTVATNALLERR